MPSDLYSLAFAYQAVGTITGDEFDLHNTDITEIFIRSGSAGTATASALVTIDAKDLDGNWFNAAVGTIAMGTAESKSFSFKRGMARGAVDPKALGVAGRVRTVVSNGSLELGINVVGF